MSLVVDCWICWSWNPMEWRLWLYRGPRRCLVEGEWQLVLGPLAICKGEA